MVATFNNRQYHLHKASGAAIAAERERNRLLQKQALVEAKGSPFTEIVELHDAERKYEASIQKLGELTLDLAAVDRMIERLKNMQGNVDGKLSLVAQGDTVAVQTVIENTDSELLVVAGICEDIQIFPDLDRGTAVFEFAQMLDRAFERDGLPLVLARLSEEEKLITANAVMRELEKHVDDKNPVLARRRVVEIIDRGESLQRVLGVSLANILSETEAIKHLPSPLLLVLKDGTNG